MSRCLLCLSLELYLLYEEFTETGSTSLIISLLKRRVIYPEEHQDLTLDTTFSVISCYLVPVSSDSIFYYMLS